MKELNGIAASKGIAIGTLKRFAGVEDGVEKRAVADADSELARLEKAKDDAIAALNQIYLSVLKRVGEKESMIFQIHIMMLQDEDFFGAIQNRVREEKVGAEYAVWQTGKQFSAMFSNMDDEYMRGRAADVLDISRRLIHTLDPNVAAGLDQLKERCVVAAVDLMPSETAQMDPELVMAFVTREGSQNSHSAILARTMGIPAVVGLGEQFAQLSENSTVIVDGASGRIFLDPDETTLGEYRDKKAGFDQEREELKRLKGTRARTKNGIELEINANIGHPSDARLALENDADGIGLFRSEFLYMDSGALPTEEQQFAAYRDVLQKMSGRRVIIRTLDLGADKQVPYLNLPKEANPALGYRAIRICLDRKELFVTQLRALYRASSFGRLAIMFPMIISLDEIHEIKQIAGKVREDLEREKIPFSSQVELGIMVETPAAVMLSDQLAKEVDFFSIGTNDLTQYTLAVDRMNHTVSKLFDPRHPAVLRMIEQTVKNGREAGIWTGICGESAADTALTEFYVKIGIRELSVTPSAVLELKKAVQQLS